MTDPFDAFWAEGRRRYDDGVARAIAKAQLEGASIAELNRVTQRRLEQFTRWAAGTYCSMCKHPVSLHVANSLGTITCRECWADPEREGAAHPPLVLLELED